MSSPVPTPAAPPQLNSTGTFLIIWRALKRFFNWLSSTYGILLRIEILVFACLMLMCILVLLGSFRRFSSCKILRWLLFCCYTSTFTLAIYTIGFMQSAPFHNDVFVIWAACLLLVLGSGDLITAYDLEDNEQRWRFLVGQVLHAFFVFIYIIYYTRRAVYEPAFFSLVYYILLITIIKIWMRFHAFKLASRYEGLVKGSKFLADYMFKEDENDDHDPLTMRGYKYIVHGEKTKSKNLTVAADRMHKVNVDLEENNDFLTVEMIWQRRSKLLDSNSAMLKDLCLSFALFKLIRRRFAGYKLHEAGLRKTREFVLHGLLSFDGDFKRAFQIIELELEFLYDFFYTRYPAYFRASSSFTIFLLGQAVGYMGFSIWLLYQSLQYYHPSEENRNFHFRGKNVDIILTFVLVITINLLELIQFIVVAFSNWFRIRYVAFYMRHTQHPLKRLAWLILKLKCPTTRFSWRRKINKCSLLHDFAHRSWIRVLTLGCLDEQSNGRKVASRVILPRQVKIAIGNSLKVSNGPLINGLLCNGRSSLVRNGVISQLGWACQLQTITHQILVWHIATTLCELELEVNDVQFHEEASNSKEVATDLSGYCAYLVAIVPALLPENEFDTELICTSVISEARKFLEGCLSMESIYQIMMRFEVSQDETMILMMGAKLGKQLIQEIEDRIDRWKVLAEFWAEFILFLAPSNDPFIHAKNMTGGGEFITHLWALLTHAGILDRPPIDEDNV